MKGDERIRTAVPAPGAEPVYEPYYTDDFVTIYHGDCRELLTVVAPAPPYDYDLITDPPYGINHVSSGHWGNERIVGDEQPFDPGHLVQFGNALIFGANHFADRLPPSSGWIVWNKRDRVSRGLPGSDAELAWTTLTNQVRVFTHVWIPHTLRDEPTLHPTQKPVALLRTLIQEFSKSVWIVDPYMGSGTTLRAAKDLGRHAIGIEIDERYCEIAARRCAQEVLPVFPTGGSSVGTKNLSVGQPGKSRIMDATLACGGAA